jgi:hypothetical protein
MQYKGLNPVQVHINPSVVENRISVMARLFFNGFRVRVRAFQDPSTGFMESGLVEKAKEISLNIIRN